MTKFNFFALLFACIASGIDAFVPHRPMMLPSKTSLLEMAEEVDSVDFGDLELAVKAVTKFGMLQPDELHELADKVEAGSDNCMFEVDTEFCEKEIDDRKDVAEVLRMQAELQLRMEAIEGASLFVGDVIEESNIRARDMEMELLEEDGF